MSNSKGRPLTPSFICPKCLLQEIREARAKEEAKQRAALRGASS